MISPSIYRSASKPLPRIPSVNHSRQTIRIEYEKQKTLMEEDFQRKLVQRRKGMGALGTSPRSVSHGATTKSGGVSHMSGISKSRRKGKPQRIQRSPKIRALHNIEGEANGEDTKMETNSIMADESPALESAMDESIPWTKEDGKEIIYGIDDEDGSDDNSVVEYGSEFEKSDDDGEESTTEDPPSPPPDRGADVDPAVAMNEMFNDMSRAMIKNRYAKASARKENLSGNPIRARAVEILEYQKDVSEIGKSIQMLGLQVSTAKLSMKKTISKTRSMKDRKNVLITRSSNPTISVRRKYDAKRANRTQRINLRRWPCLVQGEKMGACGHNFCIQRATN